MRVILGRVSVHLRRMPVGSTPVPVNLKAGRVNTGAVRRRLNLLDDFSVGAYSRSHQVG